MAEVDTSSYPKPAAPPAQKSILDQAKQWGELEQQQITIGQAKLKQINDQFQLMNNELSILADPEGNNGKPYTKEQAASRLVAISKTFGFKPEVVNHMLDELNQSPNVPTFARSAALRGISTLERINKLYGMPGSYDSGQTVTPTITSNMLSGGRPVATGTPYQKQIPPTQQTYDENNQPRLQGPTPAVTPPGTVAGPQDNLPFPVQRVPTQTIRPQQQSTLPIAPRNDTGITPEGTPVAQVMQDRYPAPSGPTAGQSPLFQQGLAEYTKDQQNAASKMLAAKPAIQALPLMQTPGFLSGPLTDQFTKAVAGLKSIGLIDIANENDPTAIRQEVVKKLSQYVSSSPVAARSDAAQTLKEASSPSPNVQILPALIKLTKDTIALDRLEAAMPNAFKGKDYQNYIKHKGNFPQNIDEKAFILDLENDGGRKIVDEMSKKLQSKNLSERNKANKFFKSLQIADEQGFYK